MLLCMLVGWFSSVHYFTACRGRLFLCPLSILSTSCITLGSVPFLSVFILFICSLLCILINLSTMCSKWLSFCFCCFCYLIPEVISRYGGGFHVSLFWLWCAWSLSPQSCNIFHCGLLIHAQLLCWLCMYCYSWYLCEYLFLWLIWAAFFLIQHGYSHYYHTL